MRKPKKSAAPYTLAQVCTELAKQKLDLVHVDAGLAAEARARLEVDQRVDALGDRVTKLAATIGQVHAQLNSSARSFEADYRSARAALEDIANVIRGEIDGVSGRVKIREILNRVGIRVGGEW